MTSTRSSRRSTATIASRLPIKHLPAPGQSAEDGERVTDRGDIVGSDEAHALAGGVQLCRQAGRTDARKPAPGGR
jgi:hypothetical protein